MKKRLLILAAFGSIIISALYLIEWWRIASRGTFHPVDFWGFYTGALLIRDGHGIQLYDLALQSQYQLSLFGKLPLNGNVLPFVSPPHLAIALVPLTILPPQKAFFIWIFVQLALLLLLIRKCLREGYSQLFLSERVILVCALLSFPMLFVTIYKGQISLILLICILLWVLNLRRKNDTGMAIWLLTGSIKPQLILIPLLLTVLARRWRALAYFAIGVTLIILICTIMIGISVISDFFFFVLRIDSNFEHRIVYPFFMYNFKGLLTTFFGLGKVSLIRFLSSAGLLASLFSIILLWRGRVDICDKKFNLKMALSLLLGIFFCTHLYFYDTLLIVAVAKLYHEYLIQANNESVRWLFILIIFLIPPFFLESSFINLSGHIIRLPVILMVLWMIVIISKILPHQASRMGLI